MNLVKINLVTLITLIILFFTFVFLWEKTHKIEQRQELHNHAQIVENALWNFDAQGAYEYLRLSTRLNDYERITIFTRTNEVFIDVYGPKSGFLEQALIDVGLIEKFKLSSDVMHEEKVIGRIEAIHINKALYIYFFVFLFTGLIFVVAHLFTRILQAKRHLERRVHERTKELLEANKELKNEINERKKVENRLEISEENLRNIFNAAHDAIFIHTTKGEIIDLNETMLNMYGVDKEEAFRFSFIEDYSMPNNPTHSMDEKWQRAVKGEPQEFEWLAKRPKDGSSFSVQVNLRKVFYSDQNAVLATVRNIEEKKQTERERDLALASLSESNRYLQAILDNTTSLVYLKDVEGKYMLINKGYERLLQITENDIKSKTDWNIFPESLARDFQLEDNQVLQSKIPGNFETTFSLNDQTYTFLTSKFPLLDDEGNAYAVGGVSTDITVRKQAEDNLAAEQEQLSVTLRSIGDGVITADTAGRIVLINKVAEELTGWKQEEAVGMPLQEVFYIINEKTRIRCENPVEKVLKTGMIIELANHTSLIAKDGTEICIADSGAPIMDKNSQMIGVVLVFRDVTEKNRMEAEMHKIKKLESVGMLAGGIAHDFNNILSAILGNISLGLSYITDENDLFQILSDAEKASLRAKDLTQQLLTFAKGGAPVKKVASIVEIIKDSAEFVLRGTNIRCEYHFDNDLHVVEIDTGQVSQVIQNIIINARHAMPSGGIINIKCENFFNQTNQISTLKPGPYIRITITDKGTGIPENIIDKIFDPYFSAKEEGSGLGLAITHSIIQKHAGHITVQSKVGEGTSFVLFLPATDKSELDRTIMEEPIERKARSPITKKGRILVMDDEEMIRKVATSMLSHIGYEVITASDGEEAVEIYKNSKNSNTPIDGIIMDLTIPGGIGGKDAIKQIHQVDPTAKVIVSSGYSNDTVMANFRDYGFCAAITKPFKLQEFTQIIEQVLS